VAFSGMTGFARADGRDGAWSWTVEARSVNGRSLEVRFRGPPGLESLERAAREAVQARMSRGQVSMGLKAKRERVGAELPVNEEALERLLDLAARYSGRPGLAPARLDGLLRLPGVLAGSQEEEVPEAAEAAMARSIVLAAEGLAAARRAEGRALRDILAVRLDGIEALVAAAGVLAASQPGVVKDRLERRLAELLAERGALEARAAEEAALHAVRADVTEELDRLRLHVAAARTLLGSDEPSGRRLDFLAQECMREANTLCSKSVLPSLTTEGLALKAAVDQFREQVQNVE
jgi:uncharacterized protein (TIGR00255 family)